MEREKDSLIETAQKKENSWELLRECTRYLKENEKNWKLEGDKNSKTAKNTRLKQAEVQKAATLARLTQKKITETWRKLPDHERRHLLAEYTKRRRHELREAKIIIWKKWRKKADKKTPSKKKIQDRHHPRKVMARETRRYPRQTEKRRAKQVNSKKE